MDGGREREAGHEQVADGKQGRAAEKEQRPVGQGEAHPHRPPGQATAGQPAGQRGEGTEGHFRHGSHALDRQLGLPPAGTDASDRRTWLFVRSPAAR